MKFFLEREYFTEHLIHTKFVTNTGYGLLVCTMKICSVVMLRHRKGGSQIEKHQIDDIFSWYFWKVWQNIAKIVQDDDGVLLQSSRLLSCFKLIAVIDCASKMMMSSARVIMLFVVRFALALHFFVSFLLRTIEEFFLCWFSTTFFTLFTNIEQETHSILFSGLIWLIFYASIVFQTFEKPIQQIM